MQKIIFEPVNLSKIFLVKLPKKKQQHTVTYSLLLKD